MKRMVMTVCFVFTVMVIGTFGFAATFATNPTGVDYGYDGESVGNLFKVGATSITVSALGIWDRYGDGLANSYNVGIYDLDKNLLVSATVSSGVSARIEDGSRWTDLASSVKLNANTEYIVATFRPNFDDRFSWVTSTEVDIASGTTLLDDRYSTASYLKFPKSSEDLDGIVGPNFQFTTDSPAAVPEPATILGFGIPMLMVGLGKLKQLRK